MKTLSKTPVLDKGYVALYSSSISNEDLKALWSGWTKGFDKQLLNLPVAHIAIKCPLFVQLQFAQFGLQTLVQRGAKTIEAFVPTVTEVAAKDLEASKAIAADIEQTTAALLINPKAYRSEACDTFISQIISPVSVYNSLIVSGTLRQWIDFVSQSNIPVPIEVYRAAVENILALEWNILEEWIRNGNKKT